MGALSAFFYMTFFFTFIAFIVYWWKKRKAKKAAGENYQSDMVYQGISKTKRMIGIVCIVSLCLSSALQPEKSPEEKARIAAEKQAKAEKEAAEKTEKARKEVEEVAKKIEEQKIAERQRNLERVSNLNEIERVLYDAKFQEYIANNDEDTAIRRALQDVDSANEEQRKKEEEQRKLDEIIDKKNKDFQKELSNGWEKVDVDEDNENRSHAMSIMGKYGANLRKASATNINYKKVKMKPWEYYGKVVTIQGEVTNMRQFPPPKDNYFNPYGSLTIACGDFDFVFIDVWGDVTNLQEGQYVTVKGLIYGLTSVENLMGGNTDGIGMVGIIQ